MCKCYDTPYRHLIKDGFLSTKECLDIHSSWPDHSWEGWIKYEEKGPQSGKRASNLLSNLPHPCSEAIRKIALLTTELSEAFGVSDLIPDLGLYGGGLHDMEVGSKVGTHTDAVEHPRLGYQRVLSAVIYLGSPCESVWKSCWGGKLNLLYGDGLPCREIEPTAGRLIVFNCRRGSLHRVETVTCPEGMSRRSLALWFYTGNSKYTNEKSPDVTGGHYEGRHTTAYFLGYNNSTASKR